MLLQGGVGDHGRGALLPKVDPFRLFIVVEQDDSLDGSEAHALHVDGREEVLEHGRCQFEVLFRPKVVHDYEGCGMEGRGGAAGTGLGAQDIAHQGVAVDLCV